MKRGYFLQAAFGVSVFGLLLVGCGGGHHDDGDPSGTTVSQNTVTGRAQLPTGATIPANQLQLLSGVASASVSDSGDFRINTIADTPTLATLFWNARPILLGMLDGTIGGTIDATSTATAFLFLCLGGWQFPLDQRAQFLALIAAHPATAAFAQTILGNIWSNCP